MTLCQEILAGHAMPSSHPQNVYLVDVVVGAGKAKKHNLANIINIIYILRNPGTSIKIKQE